MSEPVIEATGVSKLYGHEAQQVAALRPTDFSLTAGEFVMITGPSGSGKSTLLAIVSGLLAPTKGRVRMLGCDLTGLAAQQVDRMRLNHLGFIFQGFHLLPFLTALDQVSLLLERQGHDRRTSLRRARETLEEVGLAHRLGSVPAQLSGGERQRVAVARALAKQPSVIFADEPTSALDSENGAQVGALLQKASRDHGAAIVCVTHDVRLRAHASRQITMEDGILSDA